MSTLVVGMAAWLLAGLIVGWIFGGIIRLGGPNEPQPVSTLVRRVVRVAILLGLVALGIVGLLGGLR